MASPARRLVPEDHVVIDTVPVCQPTMPQFAALETYIRAMDEARWYSNFGPLIGQFEARLSDRLTGPANITTVTNATTGLALTLKALGAPAGSLCLLPAWTFVASAHAVAQAGLVPWFQDVDPKTWMLDPEHVRAALDSAPGQVGAIMPVAAFGRMLNLAAWARLQVDTGIPILLDAAAAFDALKSVEIPAVVSLHATKALGVGEGGYLAAKDPDLVSRVRQMTNFGFAGSRNSEHPAINAKLSEYAGAVGLASLDMWPQTRERYLRTAQRIRMACSPIADVRFQPGWGTEWVSSVCVVEVPEGTADAVVKTLEHRGIATRQWWGKGCHRTKAFENLPCPSLPETDRLARSTLGLPFAADLTDEAITRLASALRAAFHPV